MDALTLFLLIGLIVFCTFTAEGISGFGSTVMALPFISMLIGVQKAVPMLSALSIILSLFIISRSWKSIDFREYLFIVLHVGCGVPIGLVLMDHLPKVYLLGFLIAFMFFAGIKGLISMRCKAGFQTVLPKKNFFDRAVLFCGGIIQGVFSSGGPLVIIYASKALPEKTAFRATLTSLWLTTNCIMVTKWSLVNKVWTPELLRIFAGSLPFIAGGMLLGNFLHNKVNQYYFKVLVYTVLLIAGMMLTCNLLKQLRVF